MTNKMKEKNQRIIPGGRDEGTVTKKCGKGETKGTALRRLHGEHLETIPGAPEFAEDGTNRGATRRSVPPSKSATENTN